MATSADTSTATELSWQHSWLLRWAVPALLTLAAIWCIWFFAIRPPQPELTDVLGGTLGAAVCVFYARYLDRAKRVWIDADEIVVSDYTQTVAIPRVLIATATSTRGLWPARIRIEFSNPTVLGTHIFFFPPPAIRSGAHREITDRLTG